MPGSQDSKTTVGSPLRQGTTPWSQDYGQSAAMLEESAFQAQPDLLSSQDALPSHVQRELAAEGGALPAAAEAVAPGRHGGRARRASSEDSAEAEATASAVPAARAVTAPAPPRLPVGGAPAPFGLASRVRSEGAAPRGPGGRGRAADGSGPKATHERTVGGRRQRPLLPEADKASAGAVPGSPAPVADEPWDRAGLGPDLLRAFRSMRSELVARCGGAAVDALLGPPREGSESPWSQAGGGAGGLDVCGAGRDAASRSPALSLGARDSVGQRHAWRTGDDWGRHAAEFMAATEEEEQDEEEEDDEEGRGGDAPLGKAGAKAGSVEAKVGAGSAEGAVRPACGTDGASAAGLDSGRSTREVPARAGVPRAAAPPSELPSSQGSFGQPCGPGGDGSAAPEPSGASAMPWGGGPADAGVWLRGPVLPVDAAEGRGSLSRREQEEQWGGHGPRDWLGRAGAAGAVGEEADPTGRGSVSGAEPGSGGEGSGSDAGPGSLGDTRRALSFAGRAAAPRKRRGSAQGPGSEAKRCPHPDGWLEARSDDSAAGPEAARPRLPPGMVARTAASVGGTAPRGAAMGAQRRGGVKARAGGAARPAGQRSIVGMLGRR